MNEEVFYQETQLSDGPMVVSHSMPAAQSVALGIFVDVGSRDEMDREAGASHALEHMVFKGTKSLDVHALAGRLDDLGGNANAFTSRERTCFHLHVLHEAWPEALSLLVDMVLNPAIPEQEWQREREVIYAEMGMVEDSPEEWVMDQHVAELYSGHSLGRPVLGFHDTLSGMTADELRRYQHEWYCPPRLLIVAAGRIEHQQLAEAVAEALSGKSWAQEKHRDRASGKSRTGLQALERDGEQAQLVLSYPGIEVASDERPLAWLANQALGGGLSSRLFREVREKRGLAYAVSSHLSMLSDTGSWSVSCGMEPERGAECVQVVADVLADFAATLTDEEIARASRQLEVQLRMGLDAVEGQMLYLGGRLDEARLLSPLQWVEQIRAADYKDVRRWIGEHLAAEPLWTVSAPKKALLSICQQIRASVRPC